MLDPIGEEREDVRMAYVCSTIANVVMSAVAGKKAKLTKVGDFMPEWDKGNTVIKDSQTNEQIYATLMGMATRKKKKDTKK